MHTSTSGSLEGAARQAADLGASTFQIFSASPRMWRARAPHAQQVRLLAAARHRYDLRPLVIHVNYLINLPSEPPPQTLHSRPPRSIAPATTAAISTN